MVAKPGSAGSLPVWQRFKPFWAPVFLCFLVVPFFWRIFQGEVVYWGTPLLQFYPWRKLAVEIYAMGEVPLWNPYAGFGAPLAANLQSGVFYPLNLIYFLVPVERAMGYTVAIHVALAGLFAYFYIRTLGLSPWGSTIGGLAFMFSGFLVSRGSFLSMVSTAPWLPALFWGVERTCTSSMEGGSIRRTLFWVAISSFFVAMVVLAGHIQLAYYGLGAALAYGLFRIISRGHHTTGRSESDPKSLVRWWGGGILALGMAFLLGGAMAGVQLIPTAELVGNSVRSMGAPPDQALSYSLWPGQLLEMIAPDFFGNPAYGEYWGPANYWEGASYVGVLPLVLAVVGLWSRHPVRPFFIGLALISLIMALGRYTPLYPWLFGWFPGLGFFQAPARFLYLYTISMAMLAAMGAEVALERPTEAPLRSLALWATAIGGGILIGAGGLWGSLGAGGSLSQDSVASLAQGGLFLVVSGVLLSTVGRRFHFLWRMGVVGFISLDLFFFGKALVPTVPDSLYQAQDPPFQTEEVEGGFYRYYIPERYFNERLFQNFSFKSFRSEEWETLRGLWGDMMPNLPTASRRFQGANYDPIKLERTHNLSYQVDDKGFLSHLLGMMNVKYLLVPDEPRDPALRPIYNVGHGGTVFENRNLLPRAYVVHSATTAASGDEALRKVMAPGFDPRREVVLEKASVPPSHRGEGKSDADIIAYEAHRVAIRAFTESDGYLVLSDAYYPGWKALVDGAETEIVPANYAFRAVFLPSGEHTVEFTYEPLSFKVGTLFSGVGFLASLVLLGLGLRPGRKG